MEYIIIERERINTSVYAAGKRIYHKKSNVQGGIRLRCRLKSCSGYALLDESSNKVFIQKAHAIHCKKDPLLSEEIRFRNHLKRAVLGQAGVNIKTIYDEVVLGYPDQKPRVRFASVKPHLCRLRKNSLIENQVQTNREDKEPSSQPSTSRSSSRPTCSICMDGIKQNPVINVPCGHGFCKRCSKQALKASKKCSLCRKVVKSTVEYFMD